MVQLPLASPRDGEKKKSGGRRYSALLGALPDGSFKLAFMKNKMMLKCKIGNVEVLSSPAYTPKYL